MISPTLQIITVSCSFILLPGAPNHPVSMAGPTAEAVADDDSQSDSSNREETFQAMLTDAVLVGSFTVDGSATSTPPKAERYEIRSVTPVAGNLWTFQARIKYGNLDTTLPITVPVEWAGDTPMVTLTDARLPGLGDAFSARVLFYEDRYAGTWQHGEKGGHMFGRIEKAKAASGSN